MSRTTARPRSAGRIGEYPHAACGNGDWCRRYRLAIDDAGAGYAGLKHVMRLGPDLIKLDRSLVAGVEHDAARASLIESFVGYGRDSGATVCAEGIETVGDLVRLADLDVAYGQGYVITRPTVPWACAAPEAVDACTVSFTAALAVPRGDDLDRWSGSWPAPAARTISRPPASRSRASYVPTGSYSRPRQTH